MAPESLTDMVYSTESDVWSFGVVLWEFFTLGQMPYPGMSLSQLTSRLQTGYRLEKPVYAPDHIGRLMSQCWKMDPCERPTFNQLEATLGEYLEKSSSGRLLVLNEPYVIMNEAQRDVNNKDEFIPRLINKHSKTRLNLTELEDDDEVFLESGAQVVDESQKDTESKEESSHSSSAQDNNLEIEQENVILPEEVVNVEENSDDILQQPENEEDIETDISLAPENTESLEEVDVETWSSSSEDSSDDSDNSEKTVKESVLQPLPENTTDKNTEISFTV